MFVLALLTALVANASTDPSQDPSSFQNLAVASTPNFVNKMLSAECVASLKTPHAFDSSVVRPNLVAVKDIPYLATSDGVFFHYTDSQAALNSPETMFPYLRRSSSYDPFLYVAGDDQSSHAYGDGQIRVEISPEAKVYFPTSALPSIKGRSRTDTGFDFEAWRQVSAASNEASDLTAKLIQKNPWLSPCESVRFGAKRGSNFILTLALENERVALIAYYGTVTAWFEVTGQWAIDRVSIGKAPPLTEEVLKQRQWNRAHPLHP